MMNEKYYITRTMRTNDEWVNNSLLSDMVILLKLKVGPSYRQGYFFWEMTKNTYADLVCNFLVRQHINMRTLYGYPVKIVDSMDDGEVVFTYDLKPGVDMKEGDITFVNVVVELIRCYCKDNDADANLIFDAISTAFKNKENKNGDENKAASF